MTFERDRSASIRSRFQASRFGVHLGIELIGLGEGWAEASVPIAPEFLQNHEVVHGGLLATLGDQTAGAAASTVIPIDARVLTVEFKINFLRSAKGQLLRCRSDAIKAGRTIVVAEAKVHAVAEGATELVATMSITLAVVSLRAGQ